MSTKNQDQIQAAITNNRPDYATLFGSVELCDCEHCRSIYSPAAYLVDLLQFLDHPELGVTPLDVLIGNTGKKITGRRPDLAHIQLSCENTNTTLPYVDLVNEVLESYIAFQQTLPLKTDAAGAPLVPAVPLPNESSDGVTAAELAANPENTRDAAYEELEAAVYPFTLPFNQPITALRLTLEQMGSSRQKVMAVFGKQRDETAGRARDVEALKLTEHEFAILTGEQFDGAPTPEPITDFYGFESPKPPTDTAWVNGAVPAGAQQQLLGDTWAFAAFDPPPASGVPVHTSTVAAGLHQHFFIKAAAAHTLSIEPEDFLFAEIFLDPANLPQEIILQWNDGTPSSQWSDGTWEHRAYWGPSESLIKVGVEGTASRRYMGPLPAAGSWQRLEVPAAFVGVAGRELSGMAFTLFGGGATWGAAGKRSPSWAESLTHVPTFLARTGISYVELIALLRLHYINPALPQGDALAAFERIPISYGELARLVNSNFADLDTQTRAALADAWMTKEDLEAWAAEHFGSLGTLMVLDAPDSACDLTLTRLQHLDGTLLEDAELSRLHRFIRLWRKIGWTVQDVDRAITALQAPDITPGFLRQLGQIVQLQAILELSSQQLLSFWGTIPTDGDDALYHKLFLNKSVRDIDSKFEADNGEYLRSDPADLDEPKLLINKHLPALLAGLRTRAADLALIRTHVGLAADDALLTLATATVLYRYVTLARALKMAVSDLIALQAFSGERPFSILLDSKDGFKEIDPARTLHFVDLADRVKRSGFTPASLGYLFSKLEDAPSNLAPSAESIALLLGTIREGLVRIATENIPVDDPTGDVTHAKLGLLFEAHIVEQLGGLIGGTQISSVPLASLPVGVELPLPFGKVTYDDKNRLLKASGWVTDIEKASLLVLANVDDFKKAVNFLYDEPRELLHETLVKRLGWKKVEADLKSSVLEATSFDADGNLDPALVADKYKAFLDGALPYLRNALSCAFVKQTLADALTLDPTTAALLLEGADGVVPLGTDADSALPAIADFLALIGDGLTATPFENEAWAEPGQTSRVDPTIDARWEGKHGFSVRWEGTLLADKTQRYQFLVRAGGTVKLTLDGQIQPLIDQQEDTTPKDKRPREYTAAYNLEAGKRHALKLEYANHAAAALVELRWSSLATPAEIVPSYRLYSTARGDVSTAAKHTFIRLHKAALLVNGFKLAQREVAYLAAAAPGDRFDLNKLPVEEAAPGEQYSLFTAWTHWNDFTVLRAAARADPSAFLDTLSASTATLAQAALVRATGWDANTLATLAGPEGFALQDADYQDTEKLLKLDDAMRLLALLRAPVAEVIRWAADAPSMKEARDAAQEAKRAHKAQYDSEAWLEIARPIADQLRERQRAALVAYLLPQLGYTDSGQLFEHFLIDVEMDPCMQTSRIKQAISSVQLFIQRCRMNLEQPQVSPKIIDSDRWQWIQNYRVWEVNLKVFLYPENWIEPELRDDKSPFFRELEAELLQAEATNDTAEVALGNYLQKLDTVSQLQICGMFEETHFAPDEKRQSVLHVFGHTFTTPRVLYYRQLVTVDANYRYWTAWEKVPLDIQADEVLPVIWNRRLYLFWPIITEKASNNKKTTLIRLAWSECRQGKWSAKQVTAVDQAVNIDYAISEVRIAVENNRGDLTIIFNQSVRAYHDSRFDSTFNYGIDKKGTIIGKTGYQPGAYNIASFTFRNYNGLAISSSGTGKFNYHAGFQAKSINNLEFIPVEHPDAPIPVFGLSLDTIDLYSPGTQPFTLNDYFFIQEGPRTYLVLPSSSERSDLEYHLTDGVQPYVPTAKAVESFATKEKSNAALLASLTQLSTNANPWVAGQASITATEANAFSKPDSVMSSISITSEVFKYGVVNPGALLAQLYPAKFKFETFFHPYAAEFQRRLNRSGVAGLLNIESQQAASLPKVVSFLDAYAPDRMTVTRPLPMHDVDFEFTGAYSLYNWEIFFHLPLFMATRLSQNQRFEEAMRWFHYIFDPTAGSPADPPPQSYWKMLPFRQTHPQRLDDMLKALHAGDQNVIAQWQDLQANPFKPHRVARLRLSAYQKTVVMKYIDNLLAWGDQLFRQDTIETINQATQLYVLAGLLLGPKVQRIPPRGRSTPKTYAQLRSLGLGKFNEAIVSFENDLPFTSRATGGESATETTGLLGIGRSFYFCTPKNDKLLGYWDTVADRLSKIRHCMNIEGVVRALPLFEPPIDPTLLVRAAAQGIDLSSVLSDLSAPLPHYRFTTLLGKALEITAELRALGAALLAALEKRDSEHLVNLRASHETELLSLVKQVKQQQLAEAQTAEEGLRKSREVTQTRFDFYSNIQQRIDEEKNQQEELEESQKIQETGQFEEILAEGLLSGASDISMGFSPGGSAGTPSPTISFSVGRTNLMAILQAADRARTFLASVHNYESNRSSILGAWKRRADEWGLQKNLAAKELAQIDKQITAASIRTTIAQQELDNTTRQIEQSQEIQEFLRNKFTGEDLYNWMVGDISTIYFQCYQLAYDWAKKAERSCRFELGLATSNFIRFGAWDSMRKGLLSGERLYLQLKQMERAYLDGNRREYELTKHYSLVLNDPEALIRLKGLGQCEVDLPEALFDSDYPGHYMRRIKSVSLTIPAVVGPYTGVNCTLTLLKDKTRVKATSADGYAERDAEEDDRFVINWAPLQAIATSTGQNDSGMFELNFLDERYLPFEGAGVVSRWRIELDPDSNGFDFSDVVLQIRYTSRQGGEALKTAAKAALAQAIGEEAAKPQARLFSLKHEFPTEWYQFTHTAAAAVGTFTLTMDRFPFLFRSRTLTAGKVSLFAVLKDGADPALPLSVKLMPPDSDEKTIEFELRKNWREIQAPKNTPNVQTEIKATPEHSKWVLITDSGDLAKNVDDLLLVCEYTVAKRV